MKLNLQTIIIDVNEQITKKNINKFLLSNLELQNIDIENKVVKYNYLQESLKYQIFIFKEKIEAKKLESFNNFYNNNEVNSIDLFKYMNYIFIYKNGLFYYFYELEYELNDSDLKEFIFSSLNIIVDNIYNISVEQINSLFNTKYKLNLKVLSIENNSGFIYYLLYIFLLFCLSLIFYFYMINEHKEKVKTKNHQVLQTKKIQEQKYLYKAFYIKFATLEKLLKKYKLKIELYEYKNKKNTLILNSKNKENLFNFLEVYQKKVLKSTISFDEEKRVFRCILNVRTN